MPQHFDQALITAGCLAVETGGDEFIASQCARKEVTRVQSSSCLRGKLREEHELRSGVPLSNNFRCFSTAACSPVETTGRCTS